MHGSYRPTNIDILIPLQLEGDDGAGAAADVVVGEPLDDEGGSAEVGPGGPAAVEAGAVAATQPADRN